MKRMLVPKLKQTLVCMFSMLVILFQTPGSIVASITTGNPDGNGKIPPEARAEDVSKPDHIIGIGTPESCTGEAFIKAVAQGGKIVFNGGD